MLVDFFIKNILTNKRKNIVDLSEKAFLIVNNIIFILMFYDHTIVLWIAKH